ncbi:MAG TPA: DDE transposase, partial [Bacteroidetes bacterium]|nr:DDE transposase [Bacteroidota bacterium]
QTRANVLFGLSPEIEQAYHLSCQFRNFMSKKNIGRHYLQIEKQLHQWYQDTEDADINEMLNFKAMAESNEQYIVNYFIQGETNALAEGINSKIQKFISSNQGARDRDFFFFRLANYFS